MPRPARIVRWNGRDLPPEFRDLPAGRYMVEAVEDDAPKLTRREEVGIETALESYRQGCVVNARDRPPTGSWNYYPWPPTERIWRALHAYSPRIDVRRRTSTDSEFLASDGSGDDAS